jgi:hypothetical protein
LASYKQVPCTAPVEQVLKDGPSDASELAEEMRSWYDNMSGTPAENSSKYSQVEEAADTLERASGELEHACGQILEALEGEDALDAKVDWVEMHAVGKRHITSRAHRAGNITASLRAAVEFLEKSTDLKDELTGELPEDVRDGVSVIDDALSDLDGVEFPGMYG